jgi:hypothetical protein
VYEVYGAPTDWEGEELQRLKPYLMLGSDAGDNPLCLDTANQGRIVWLDHEGFWVVQFVNSSVAQLAECLLVYAEMTEASQREGGAEGDPFGASPSLIQQLSERIGQVDVAAMEANCFWQQWMQGLEW